MSIQNKYTPGDVVCAKVNPSLKLKISRYTDQIYYCKVLGDPEATELIYYERELVEDRELAVKYDKLTVWENEGGSIT